MICCCSLAGTKACENCNARIKFNEMVGGNYTFKMPNIKKLSTEPIELWVDEISVKPNRDKNNLITCGMCNGIILEDTYCRHCGIKIKKEE